MTTQQFSGCSFDSGNVTVDLTYDDVTLIIQSVIYQNLSVSNLVVTLITPGGPIVLPALIPGTPLTTLSVVADAVTMNKTTVTGKFGPGPSISLPAGYGWNFAWPG